MFLKKKRKKKAQIETNVRASVFNAGLLARSQFASGKSCDWPTRSRVSLVPEQMLNWYPIPCCTACLIRSTTRKCVGPFTVLNIHCRFTNKRQHYNSNFHRRYYPPGISTTKTPTTSRPPTGMV
jgi:hypothetical protein